MRGFSILLAVITLVVFGAWLLPDPVASAQSCGGMSASSGCSGSMSASSCSGSVRSGLVANVRSRIAERRSDRRSRRASRLSSCSGVQSVGCSSSAAQNIQVRVTQRN